VATAVRRSTVGAPSAAGTIPLSSSFVVNVAHGFKRVPLRRLELRLEHENSFVEPFRKPKAMAVKTTGTGEVRWPRLTT
jgi:hypothetical protein